MGLFYDIQTQSSPLKKYDSLCTQSKKLKEDISVAFDPENVGWKMMYNFHNMVMLHIKLIGITKCSNMEANILPTEPTPSPTALRNGIKWSKFNFFRTWSCCISILFGITKCRNMEATILPADPLTLGVKRSKFNFFRTLYCCISN